MQWVRLRPRFTVRGLMALVAVAGVAAGAEGMRRRSEADSALARRYASLVDRPPRLSCGWAAAQMGEEKRRLLGEESRRRVDYYRAMEARYRRSARYPWLPAGPEPFAPDELTWALAGLTSADDW